MTACSSELSSGAAPSIVVFLSFFPMVWRGLRWVGACVFIIISLVMVLRNESKPVSESQNLDCGVVDVVYTWVNGSNPKHIAALKSFATTTKDDDSDEVGRYRDYDTLRYSMRTIFKMFPSARLIHLLIADYEDVPSWLDSKHPRIRIVRHSQIMSPRVLPTFNSNGIETNLHLIPDLAQCFLYLNDDMLIARPIASLHSYWDSKRGAPFVHFGTWTAPMTDLMPASAWHSSMAASNQRLGTLYGDASRAYPVHGCYFFHKKIFETMRNLLDESFKETLSRRFRGPEDNVVSFLYPHVAIQQFGGVAAPYSFHYAAVSSDRKANADSFAIIARRRPECVCINDDFGSHSDEEIRGHVNDLRAMLELLVPDPAPWERVVSSSSDRVVASNAASLYLLEWFLRTLIGVPLAAAVAWIITGMIRRMFFK